MRFKIIILVFIGLHSILLAQSSATLELNQQLQTANRQDSIHLLEEWAWENRKQSTLEAATVMEKARDLCGDSLLYYELNRKLAIILFHSGRIAKGIEVIGGSLNYFERKGNVEELAITNFEASFLYAENGNSGLSDSLLQRSKPLLLERGQADVLIRSYILEATNCFYRRQYQAGLERCREAMELCHMPRYQSFKPSVLRCWGFLEMQEGHYDKALAHFFELLEIGADAYTRNHILIQISTIYQFLEDWEKALQYQLKALDASQQLHLPVVIAYHLKEIGTLYLKQQKKQEALVYLQRALVVMEGGKIPHDLVGNILTLIGDIQQALTQQEQADSSFEQAIYHYEQIAKAHDLTHLKDTSTLLQHIFANNANYMMAELYFKRNQLDKALEKAKQCITIEKRVPDRKVKQYANQLLAKIYQAKGMPEEAHPYYAAYLEIKSNMVDMEEMRAITSLEQEVAEAEHPALPKISQSNLYLWVLILGSLLAGLLLWLIFSQRRSTGLPSKAAPPETTITSMSSFLLENIQGEQDWSTFTQYFQQVHPNFFKRLKEQYPAITSNELNLCALLKLNIQNKEIAQLLAISPSSVRTAQHRLSKKISVPDHQSLRDYILLF
ncbi:MAG: tetratricopeptide repeat protein [Bacteroidota bacterium]